MWSLSHFLTGAVIAGTAVLLNVPFWISVVIAVFLLSFWEFYEIFRKIRETISNRWVDVILGLLGYAIMYFVMSLGVVDDVVIFLVVTIPLVIVSLLGLMAYKAANSGKFLRKFKK